MIPTREFDQVNKIFGWGDPGNPTSRGIWFIGIEEGSNWIEDSKKSLLAEKSQANQPPTDVEVLGRARVQIHEYYEKSKVTGFTPLTGEEKWGKSPVRSYCSKIAFQFSTAIRERFGDHLYRDDCRIEASKIYQNTILWMPGSGVCNANIFPLGQAIEKGNELYKLFGELFGLSKNDLKEYKKDLEEYKKYMSLTRFMHMRRCWEHCQPQATICYVGERYKSYIEELFKIVTPWKPLDGNGSVFSNDDNRILLTLHFSRPGMSDQRANLIAGQLEKWEVKLSR